MFSLSYVEISCTSVTLCDKIVGHNIVCKQLLKYAAQKALQDRYVYWIDRSTGEIGLQEK